MNRDADLRNMDAPGVGSGKEAGDTILKGTASMTASEKGSNELNEYVAEKNPVGGAGGRATH